MIVVKDCSQRVKSSVNRYEIRMNQYAIIHISLIKSILFRLHYTTLHYTTLHYTTLHYKKKQKNGLF